jgi:anti-anti-sigma factor
VEIQAQPGQAILVLHGELDMATESRLRDVAMAQLEVSGLAKLGLDLADITFLDSCGISVLVDLRNQPTTAASTWRLAVSQRAARVPMIVGLPHSASPKKDSGRRSQPTLSLTGARNRRVGQPTHSTGHSSSAKAARGAAPEVRASYCGS